MNEVAFSTTTITHAARSHQKRPGAATVAQFDIEVEIQRTSTQLAELFRRKIRKDFIYSLNGSPKSFGRPKATVSFIGLLAGPLELEDPPRIA